MRIKEAINNYARITGMTQDYPRQTRTYGHLFALLFENKNPYLSLITVFLNNNIKQSRYEEVKRHDC